MLQFAWILIPVENIKIFHKNFRFKLNGGRRYKRCKPKFLNKVRQHTHMHQPYHNYMATPACCLCSLVGLLPQYKIPMFRHKERLTSTMPVMCVMLACSWLAQTVLCLANSTCQRRESGLIKIDIHHHFRHSLLLFVAQFVSFNLYYNLSCQWRKAATGRKRCCTAKCKNTT